MKNSTLYLFLSSFFIVQSVGAQKAEKPLSFTMDHFAINVRQLDKAVDWYQAVFHLEEIYDGTELDHIRWFDLGNNQELHIIQVEDLKLDIPKGVHLALTTADLDRFTKQLDQMNIDYYDWPGKVATKSVRPDGIEQVYIQDPDGYWVEINNGEKRHQH